MIETTSIATLFAHNISRQIEEVIKVDQTDEEVLKAEFAEYVTTDSITRSLGEIVNRYAETPNKPHEGIAVWVSGFFGSGKSSFAKYLGLALENRNIGGQGAAEILGQRTGTPRIQVLLKSIAEHIPTKAVIFDVSTDRGIRSGNQTLTEITYRQLLRSLGYANDLDLAELEIALEGEGRLAVFEERYRVDFIKEWDDGKRASVFALNQASRVMHELDPATYPSADSWSKSGTKRADITPGTLAARCNELMGRRRAGHSLVFVVDEVGQFVARDVQKMLDLQAVVQSLAVAGRGKTWIMVTSQERLGEVVGGLDDRRVELARLQDRFPLQVHLEPSDISEVTSRRVLLKNADADRVLRALFAEHRGRLTDNTRLTADIRLPDLTSDAFVDLYPLLPYQIDLIIQVVSGLRTQGGASRHVGGANRTIIKLAQQLLIHPDVHLKDEPIGALARIDQIYDLVSGNIASEVRGRIDEIKVKVPHALAQPVAKAICLLQFVGSIHRTAENIAATLHPSVKADSRLAEVKEALLALEHAHLVRQGDGGYRIPSPAEDDWERQRASFGAGPGDVNRLHAEIVETLWTPQPSHLLESVRAFKAGLYLNDRRVHDGDVVIHLTLAEQSRAFSTVVDEARQRSRTEPNALFWVAALDSAIDRETVELFRSKEILSKKERAAQTREEMTLVDEEKRRQRRHEGELRRVLRQAILGGTVFFRGNDRTPTGTVDDVRRAAESVLARTLPEVYDRFPEAAAKVGPADLNALLTDANLHGLPAVFSTLHLLRSEGGQPVLVTESGPLAEVLSRIQNKVSYGELATGKFLEETFGREPFGWGFEAVRLLAVALLRAGKLMVTCQGAVIESALSVEANNALTNNVRFRSASFQPKVGIDFGLLVEAAGHVEEVFGKQVAELEQAAVARTIRKEVERVDGHIHDAHNLLVQHTLPGADALQAAINLSRVIRGANEQQAILAFNGAHRELKEAITRAGDVGQALDEPRLHDLQRARHALNVIWRFLPTELDLEDVYREHADRLTDLMGRETFFRDLPAIDQHTRALEQEYLRRRSQAISLRAFAYTDALERLRATPGWEHVTPDQQDRVAAPLASRVAAAVPESISIPELRADVDACSARLNATVSEVMRMVDGNRIAELHVSSFFSGGIETEEQLDAALQGLREQCMELIAANKKILVR